MSYMKILLVPISVLLASGCKTDWEKQQRFLLPTENKLESISYNDNEMATIKVFSVSGTLDRVSLVHYPLQKIEGKALKKWHKASNQEIKDLEVFFQEEPIDEEISKKVLKSIMDESYYVAYMFNYNEKAPAFEKGYAHKDRNPIPGEKGYNTMSWLDIYFLDIGSKELIHISYGKF